MYRYLIGSKAKKDQILNKDPFTGFDCQSSNSKTMQLV